MKFKLVIVIVLAILLVVFGIQNTEIVNIKLWFWELNTPRAILIFVCFAIGVIIGLIVPSSRKKDSQKTQ